MQTFAEAWMAANKVGVDTKSNPNTNQKIMEELAKSRRESESKVSPSKQKMSSLVNVPYAYILFAENIYSFSQMISLNAIIRKALFVGKLNICSCS